MNPITRTDVRPGDVVLLGVPWDTQSSFLRGAAEAPTQIREALASPSSNWCAEDGRDLEDEPRFVDGGDLAIATAPADADDLLGASAPAADVIVGIEAAVGAWLARGASIVALGGDHAVSLPLVRAHARHHAGLGVLHVDAHPDLYDTFEGDPFSHACPFARTAR